MLAGILGRGVKGDASLYSFPVKLGYSMLRKRLHRSLTGPAGVLCAAHHIVFVFNIMQPPPAIKPFNLKQLKTIFDFPNCLLVCGNPSPKSARLGWDFGSSCSVGGLWLSWGSTCVSSCCLVVGVYSVVAASP